MTVPSQGPHEEYTSSKPPKRRDGGPEDENERGTRTTKDKKREFLIIAIVRAMDAENFVGLHEDYDGKYRKEREREREETEKNHIDESTIIPMREEPDGSRGGQGTDYYLNSVIYTCEFSRRARVEERYLLLSCATPECSQLKTKCTIALATGRTSRTLG